MVKAGYECHPQSTCRHTVTFATMVRYAEVTPVKFFRVSVNTLPAEHETSNVLVVIWSEDRTTPSSTERDSAQTERVLTRLAAHLHDSRVYPESRKECCTPSMD